MTKRNARNDTVLAIHLATRGFGYVVLDGNKLVDWGTKETRIDKERRTLNQLEKLLSVYAPGQVLLPDYSGYPRRQTERILKLTRTISTFAVQKNVRIRLFSWVKVCQHYRLAGATTKHKMAVDIAGRFRELAPQVPPFRKPWMSEHHRMSVFQAAAIGIAYQDGVRGIVTKQPK